MNESIAIFPLLTLFWWATQAGALAAGEAVANPTLTRLAAVQPAEAHATMITPLADRGQKATVLFFLTTECSIGNGYAPEIARIVQEYQKRGVTCYGVYAHETAAAVTRHLKDYALPFSGVLDPKLQLARLTGATVTPEACILSPDSRVLYRGRIDDRAVKPGTVRAEPSVRDLRLSLDAVLAGKPVPQPVTRAIGCYLDFPAPEK